jgi:hypothetical protein
MTYMTFEHPVLKLSLFSTPKVLYVVSSGPSLLMKKKSTQ